MHTLNKNNLSQVDPDEEPDASEETVLPDEDEGEDEPVLDEEDLEENDLEEEDLDDIEWEPAEENSGSSGPEEKDITG